MLKCSSFAATPDHQPCVKHILVQKSNSRTAGSKLKHAQQYGTAQTSHAQYRQKHTRGCSHHPPHQVEEPVFKANYHTTTKRQKAVSSLHALCKQYSHNAICIIAMIVDDGVNHTIPHVLQLSSFQIQNIGKHNMQIMLPNKHRNRQARHQNRHQHRHINESQSTATSQQQPPSPSTQQGSSISQ